MLICAYIFYMTFTNYLQVSLNCNQLLTAVLTQIRLLHKDDAGALTKNSVCTLAQVLSY